MHVPSHAEYTPKYGENEDSDKVEFIDKYEIRTLK